MRRWILVLLFLAPGWSLAENLYNPANYQPLVSDRRAYRLGDVLTVLIVENASASASADSSTQKSGGIGGTARSSSTEKSAGISLNEDFAGKGRIQRSGRLLGTITVVVHAVDEFGNLLVKGDQLIAFNGEKQEIRLEGRVRPIDILDNNTIQSTRIADARISYVGNGVLGERQNQGILSRLFSLLGLL